MSQNLPAITDVRCEAGSVLADIYCEEGRNAEAKQVLLKAMETSQVNHYWHCRLLFQASVSPEIDTYASFPVAIKVSITSRTIC